MTDFTNELPDDWRDVLPEEMRSSGVLETAKTIESLAKMAIDGRNLASTAIRVPSEEASAEDRSAFHADLMEKVPGLMPRPKEDDPDSFVDVFRALGAPESADGYELGEMPDPIKSNMAKLTDAAAQANLTKDQFAAISNAIVEDYKTSADENLGRIEQNKEALKEKWGAAYEQKLATIKHFTEQTGFSEQFIGALEGGQVAPDDILALDKVIAGFDGEGINIGVDPSDTNGVMPPDEANARIDEIMGNKGHAYWKPSDPAHKAAVEKVVELGRLAEGKAA